MDQPTRTRLRLTLAVALAVLPRCIRHDFWKQAQPQNDRAKEAMVDRLVAAVEEDFDLVERSDKTYRGWK